MMEARAKAPNRVVQAFTGRIFVAQEWRPVPDGCEAEAKRLEDAGFLELREKGKKAQKAAPIAEPVEEVEAGELTDLSYNELRRLASEHGVPSFGKKRDELIEALSDE